LKYSIGLFLLFCFTAWGFDKDLKTANDRVPLEFSYLFESMKIGIKTDAEKIRFAGLCKELDDNLGILQKEHIFLLMKSEVIKNLLEYKHEKVRSFDITSFLITRLEEDFKKKEGLLTPISKWLWRSIIAELKYRETLGLISAQSFKPQLFEGPKKAEAERLNRYLKYLIPWIDKMDSLTASEFNDLTKKVSWIILTRLNQRSILFKTLASTAATDSKVSLFNIPGKYLEIKPQDLKKMANQEEPLTLKEESNKEKTEASEQVQNLTPDDLSPLSDEITKELEQKAP
jgi:hypothetical protein